MQIKSALFNKKFVPLHPILTRDCKGSLIAPTRQRGLLVFAMILNKKAPTANTKIIMKKVFFLSILASLLVLSGCKKDDDESPVVPPTPVDVAKGFVIAHFETNRFAGDLVSVNVFINDELKSTLTKSENYFELKDIDISNRFKVVFDPVFADIAAPTEKFDFECDLSFKVSVSVDGGATVQSGKSGGFYAYYEGEEPDNYEDFLERAKSAIQKQEVIIENGEVLE